MKKLIFIAFAGVILAFGACSKSVTPKESPKKVVKKIEKVDLSRIPSELIYPGAKGLKVKVFGKEIESTLITSDDYKKVGKYYQKNLAKYGWNEVKDASYINSKESSLYFEKGNREALIAAFPDPKYKTKILVLLRPAEY